MEDSKTSKVNKQKIIGLTGNCCAGKNHVAHLLEKRHIPVLDIDKLGHQIIEAEKKHILSRFGEEILGPLGLIDRKLLGQKVFGRPKELKALEEIIHPGVNTETLTWISTQKGEICVINAALLHRSSAYGILDALIIVEASFIVRLLRARSRDKLCWTALLKRFWAQRDFSSQFYKNKTDIYKVENSGFFASKRHPIEKKLENRIDEILSRIQPSFREGLI